MRCMTFDKSAQDSLPQHIKDKMKADRDNARKQINMETVKMKFKDAPVGARFKYPKSKTIWVKLNSYPKGMHNDGNGLICQWNGNVEGHQSFCSFVDEANGIDFNTEVELI